MSIASAATPGGANLSTGIELRAPAFPAAAQVLTPAALSFVAKLHRAFESRRAQLLARRAVRQKEFDAGRLPDFIPETANLRAQEWTITPQPKDLLDRRVEITGPTDRKMVINALNSGASTFMADFEDANCPSWAGGNHGFEKHVKPWSIRGRMSCTSPSTKARRDRPRHPRQGRAQNRAR